MRRYHFHDADAERHPDSEGVELPDDDTAKVMAVRYAGELLKHNPRDLWEKGHWRVEVTGDDNALLWTVVTIAIDAPSPISSHD
jgi:hypothetical protein